MTTDYSVLDSPKRIKKILCPHCSEKISIEDKTPFSFERCPSCNNSYEVPQQIEHYLLESCIADDGVFADYRAIDLLLNRHVMIKKLNKVFHNMDRAPEFPFIESSGAVNIFSTTVHENELYLIFELIKGRSIKSYLQQSEKVDQKKVVSLAMSICNIMSEAAENGVSHGHLVPGSVWVDENGEVRITDFMLHQNILASGDSSERISKVLDVRYCTPERLKRMEVNEKNDLFSLGVCLHKILTGELPYNSTDMDSLLAEHGLSELSSELLISNAINPVLSKLVMSLLRMKDEFTSFSEVHDYLKQCFVVSKSKLKPTKGKASHTKVSKKVATKTGNKKTAVRLPVRDKTQVISSKRKLKKLFR